MSVTISAEGHDYRDALQKLGGIRPESSVEIAFRKGDFGCHEIDGAIIKEPGKIPKEFDTVAGALEYITAIMLDRKRFIESQPKESA